MTRDDFHQIRERFGRTFNATDRVTTMLQRTHSRIMFETVNVVKKIIRDIDVV
jgi:hypothetical protein